MICDEAASKLAGFARAGIPQIPDPLGLLRDAEGVAYRPSLRS